MEKVSPGVPFPSPLYAKGNVWRCTESEDSSPKFFLRLGLSQGLFIRRSFLADERFLSQSAAVVAEINDRKIPMSTRNVIKRVAHERELKRFQKDLHESITRNL